MKESLQLKLENLLERQQELDGLLADPENINNQNKFRELSQEYAEIRPIVSCFNEYQKTSEDIKAAKEILKDSDKEMQELAAEELKQAEEKHGELDSELQVLLLPKDPADNSNIFLEIRAGTGGEEAALFSGDLMRMYSRYAENRGWKIELISAAESDLEGYKEVIMRIIGEGAYSRLKFESGAHRVQRVPETESQGRIHTSACTVAVLPEAAEIDEIEINTADLRIDTFRASGAGGQHVNKTDSAIRITHEPSGVVSQCQSQRSQHQNKDKAMAQLRAKLYEIEMNKLNAEKQSLEESKADIGWGSQIRSYVLDSSRIKDLRTGVETTNCSAVLDGALDNFIEASLKENI